MNRTSLLVGGLTLAAVLSPLPLVCSAAEEGASLKDFQVDMGAGHVAANEIIGLSGSAVINLQTPKDLVATVSALGDGSSKTGFGIAFAPGRAGLGLMSIPVMDYADGDKPLARLWGSTTFSYAQSTKALGGIDHALKAIAVNVAYYLDRKEDPTVAGFLAMGGDEGSPCIKQVDAAKVAMQNFGSALTLRMNARRKELGVQTLDDAELAKIEKELGQVALASSLPAKLKAAKAAKANAAGSQSVGDNREALDRTVAELSACASEASTNARKRWNASRVDVVLGQGWIQSTAAGSDRLALGRHLAIALALSTKEMPNSLFNLTLRRLDRELDLSTIATTRNTKQSTLAAARYTYGHGEARETYALAEISNAKSGSTTVANQAFKFALGIDHKINGSVWLEFRFGRARSFGGVASESKALFNLKFSPGSTLGS